MAHLEQVSQSDCRHGLFRVSFTAMGTSCEMVYSCGSATGADTFREEAMNWVRDFENRYSRYLPDSLISRINAGAGKEAVEVSGEDVRLLDLCDSLNFLTHGLFDPSTLPLSKLWDFKAKDPKVPEVDQIHEALRLVGWKKVIRESNRIFLPEAGMGLDFGGFGKEYAVDRVFEKALSHGIENALINFGGDIRAIGSPPQEQSWRIGVEDPSKPGSPAFLLSVDDGAVATSGNYQRFFERSGRRYGHLLDHRTGYPTETACLSSTVIARSCLEAGVLATCSLLEGERNGLVAIENFFGAEGCLRTQSGIAWTKGFDRHVIAN